MRQPCGTVNDLNSVLREAKRSAEVTHNHPEGIKGACHRCRDFLSPHWS